MGSTKLRVDALRGRGVYIGGPAAYSQADRKACADQLDRLLAQ